MWIVLPTVINILNNLGIYSFQSALVYIISLDISLVAT